MKLLTNLIFEPKGKHDPALTYSIKDTVMSSDGSKVYFAVQDVPANTPLTDEDYWKLQIDLSGSKHALDEAAAAFADQVKFVGTRVKGETAKATGNPVSFLPDAGSLLQPVMVLEPQQEGSGDPYPAGGGKNLIPYPYYDRTKTVNGVTFTVNNDGSITAEGTATANGDFDITDSVSLDFYLNPEKYILSGCPAGGGEAKYYLLLQVKADSTTVAGYLDVGEGVKIENLDTKEYNNIRVWIRVVTGTTINATYYPMLRLASDPDATYAPPSNIRPFIGYDKLNLNHETENLCNLTFSVVPSVNDGLDTDVAGWASDYVYIGDKDVVLSHVLATDKCTFFLLLYDEHKNYIGHALGMTRDTEYLSSASISGHENARYCRCRLDDPTYMAASKTKLHLEFSTNGTPIKGKLHTVQIGQTVYGFRYEWLTGKAVIEWAMYTVTVGDFAKNGANQFVMTHNLSVQAFAECSCSHFIGSKRGAYDSAVNNSATVSGTGLWFYSKAFETAEEFNAFINAQYAAGTPVQIAYKLAQPIEIQLTPHVLTAVEPEQNNTLDGDGTIEVEYVKPLHVSIEERVAAALAAAAQTE